MSHIVVYQAPDGTSGFEPCTSLDEAIVTAERMRNVDGVEQPRIFKMEEVQFDFRPYFRVEVSGEIPADFNSLSAGAMSSLASAPSAVADPASDVGGVDYTSGNSFDSESSESPSTIPDIAEELTKHDSPAYGSDMSAPLERSVSAMGSLGAVESLDRLEASVEAFATDVDSTSVDTISFADLDEPSDVIETVDDVQDVAVEDVEEVEDAVEASVPDAEESNDPLVSVRRGLVGR